MAPKFFQANESTLITILNENLWFLYQFLHHLLSFQKYRQGLLVALLAVVVVGLLELFVGVVSDPDIPPVEVVELELLVVFWPLVALTLVVPLGHLYRLGLELVRHFSG